MAAFCAAGSNSSKKASKVYAINAHFSLPKTWENLMFFTFLSEPLWAAPLSKRNCAFSSGLFACLSLDYSANDLKSRAQETAGFADRAVALARRQTVSFDPMTEQEVEVFAQRLTRIWAPMRPFTHRLYTEYVFPDVWLLKAMLTPEFQLEVETRDTYRPELPFLVLKYLDAKTPHPNYMLGTACRREIQVVRVHIYPLDDLRQIAEQRMDFFRRGCWLSGIPIEASAHEKAEWIQGFTREEVEAWGLKM